MIMPFIELKTGAAEFQADVNWEFDYRADNEAYQQRLYLIEDYKAE